MIPIPPASRALESIIGSAQLTRVPSLPFPLRMQALVSEKWVLEDCGGGRFEA
jgi:hypothetical protein